MSQFEQVLRRAQRRQRLFYGVLAVGFVAVCLAVGAVLVASNGTLIKTLPKETQNFASIRIVKGYGLVAGDTVYTLTGNPTIAVTAAGFHAERREITAEDKGSAVEIHLREKPGRLLASTTPTVGNAIWYLNGKTLAQGESVDQAVEAGEYTITVNALYFNRVEQSVVLERDKETRVQFDLKRIQGGLKVSSIPANAHVEIDETKIGETPVEVSKPGGKYRLVVSKPGFQKVEETIEITNSNQNVARTYHLKMRQARIRFSLSPEGGQLMVNGQIVDPAKLLSVNAGVKIAISYRKPGFYPLKAVVSLKPAQEKDVELSLRPEIGAVSVSSHPSATVFLDGKNVGNTPLTMNLPAVPHRLEIRKKGFAAVQKAIAPKANRPLTLNFELQTELAYRLATAAKEYKNAYGIVMKLYQPGSFVMGAARHERGQRANEFLRKVHLRRPFYVGKYEITNRQYAVFGKKSAKKTDGDHPVTSIEWIDAALFCNWLSLKEGLAPFYLIKDRKLLGSNMTSEGYRLLTEAEWEWLARKAARPSMTIFPWGDQDVIQPKTTNIGDESAKNVVKTFVPGYNDGHIKTSPVGSFKIEPSGIFDMAGNASEWVHDFYSLVPPQQGVVEADPMGPTYGGAHVVKGANWRSATRSRLRAAYREGQSGANDGLGFRVARYLYGG